MYNQCYDYNDERERNEIRWKRKNEMRRKRERNEMRWKRDINLKFVFLLQKWNKNETLEYYRTIS